MIRVNNIKSNYYIAFLFPIETQLRMWYDLSLSLNLFISLTTPPLTYMSPWWSSLQVYLNATNGSRVQEVTKEEFLHSAQMMSQITPLEVDILFKLCDLLHQTG